MENETKTVGGQMRRARMDDVVAMQRIINEAADRGEMLPRSLAELYETLRDFVVWERDGEVVACCAMRVTWVDLAEIKSLSVVRSVQGKGIGSAMVQRCLDDARDLGVRRVFALTYQPGFFEKQGFRPIDKS
ncbi:MAG: GNAT family N-acetyltransferase, partial [Candidatus Hydrogenedentes bacterium]|nr:GNAT family N-acetyltransferase [Candidatus Hydrogenedentota bacterium]